MVRGSVRARRMGWSGVEGCVGGVGATAGVGGWVWKSGDVWWFGWTTGGLETRRAGDSRMERMSLASVTKCAPPLLMRSLDPMLYGESTRPGIAMTSRP